MATTGAVVALFMNSARRREKIDSEMNIFEKIEYFPKKMRKDLVDSKKSSTFALAYQKW